jgi:hypothetical protein
MSDSPHSWRIERMPRFMLEHRHGPRECGVVFASFKAFDSPLRHHTALASCDFGTHRIWWEVEAETEAEALAQLPGYAADRTAAIRVRDLRTP